MTAKPDSMIGDFVKMAVTPVSTLLHCTVVFLGQWSGQLNTNRLVKEILHTVLVKHTHFHNS